MAKAPYAPRERNPVAVDRHPVKSPPLCGRCHSTASRWLLEFHTQQNGEVLVEHSACCDACLLPNERALVAERSAT